MTPAFTLQDYGDQPTADTILHRKSAVGQPSILGMSTTPPMGAKPLGVVARPDLDDLLVSELRSSTPHPPVGSSVPDLVSHVFCSGAPADVFETVVGPAVVHMPTLKSTNPQAYEGLKNQMVDIASLNRMVVVPCPPSFFGGDNDMGTLTNSAVGAGFKARQAGDRFPKFTHEILRGDDVCEVSAS